MIITQKYINEIAYKIVGGAIEVLKNNKYKDLPLRHLEHLEALR